MQSSAAYLHRPWFTRAGCCNTQPLVEELCQCTCVQATHIRAGGILRGSM
jgi:hypothetical protein